MRSPLFCNNPSCDEQIGWEYESPRTIYGQDPPEVELFDEDLVDDEGYGYCSERCQKHVSAREEEQENESEG